MGRNLGYILIGVGVVAAVLIAAVIAIPAGWAIGHTGRGRDIAVAVSGAARAIPSFGLLLLLVLGMNLVAIVMRKRYREKFKW